MFDQTTTITTTTNPPRTIIAPIRYLSNGVVQDTCAKDMDYTDGQPLFSGSMMLNQTSCNANTGNAGNYYSFPAATVGSNISSGDAPDSICSKGWQLVSDSPSSTKSFENLVRRIYIISETDKDEKLLSMPLSFILSGGYNSGNIGYRESRSYYWSATTDGESSAYSFHATKTSNEVHLNYGDYRLKKTGHSIRCVAH